MGDVLLQMFRYQAQSKSQLVVTDLKSFCLAKIEHRNDKVWMTLSAWMGVVDGPLSLEAAILALWTAEADPNQGKVIHKVIVPSC